MRILLIDADPRAGKCLAGELAQAGHEVRVERTAGGGIDAARPSAFDAIILGRDPDRRNGPALCRQVRVSSNVTPVLMLSDHAAVADRVAGLDAGAEVYMITPYSTDELLARLRAIARRAGRTGRST